MPAIPPISGRRRGTRAAGLGVVLLLAGGSTAAVGEEAAQGGPAPPAARPCALRAVPGMAMSEGFPAHRGHEFAPTTGRVDALTLFVDFPDARAPYSAQERYAEFFPAVRDWFASSSYGRLDYHSQPVLRYLRMPHPFTSYGISRGYGWDVHTRMIRDLLSVADRRIDFSGYDLLNILVTPNAGPPTDETVLSVTWTGAPAATTDDGAGLDRISVLYGDDQSGFRVLTHENGHVFGLPDLYATDDFGRTDELAGQWDSMSLDWGLQGDLLAWHKWRLGWLDDTQIGCLAAPGRVTYDLRPISLPGGSKAVVVPYGRSRAYVVEARAARGNDSQACREGVLVYRVRTDIDSGNGPVTVMDARPDSTACDASSGSFNSLNDAPYRSGGRFTDRAAGLTVEVLGRTAKDEWTVRVARR